MQFIDLNAIKQRSASKIDAAITTVLEHGRFINGPEVHELEAALCDFLGCADCVAVASGTMALEIALRALGIGPGDEVITTPFTWISTAETIALVGATPVFADIEADTYNINPLEVEKVITPRTKAIIPVDLFGQMANYHPLQAIADKHNLRIIEDAAQSFGAEQEGRKSCTMGDVATTSFFPAKPLGCFGDGGAVFTQDPELGEKLRAITNHGCKEREYHYVLGTNGRCDTLQAAITLAKFDNFRDEEIGLRQRVGQRYSDALRGHVVVPSIHPGNTHIYAQYTIRSRNRDSLATALKEAQIPSAVYYRRCLHEQEVFAHLPSAKMPFPNAMSASKEVISLPFHPYLSETDQDRIIATIIQH
ncbi:MAG: DegT/DnrJ/EryC1/StrS family aminotransferase, partial [Opitutales bacterium]